MALRRSHRRCGGHAGLGVGRYRDGGLAGFTDAWDVATFKIEVGDGDVALGDEVGGLDVFLDFRGVVDDAGEVIYLTVEIGHAEGDDGIIVVMDAELEGADDLDLFGAPVLNREFFQVELKEIDGRAEFRAFGFCAVADDAGLLDVDDGEGDVVLQDGFAFEDVAFGI